MSTALTTLRNARRAAEGNLAIARRAHTQLVEECNRQIEASATTVNLATVTLNDYDQAIETLEGAR